MRRFILGTDFWTDCDDAVALRLLTNAVKKGEIDLLGIAINACMEFSVASVKGFLKADGVENIPIGIDLNATDFGGNPPFQKRLAENFCPDGRNQDGEDALRLYRRLLAEAEERVEILEIGYPQVLSALLKSTADDISEKDGLTLFREKVSRVWMMAGKWDADGEKENNFCRNARSRMAAKTFCELCPVPVIFLGWEVGYGVISGGDLPEDDPLHSVLVDHKSPNGRHSWDPMLVLLALIGDENAAGYDTVVGTARVDEQSGANFFCRHPLGNHQFVVKRHDNAYYANEINRLCQRI